MQVHVAKTWWRPVFLVPSAMTLVGALVAGLPALYGSPPDPAALVNWAMGSGSAWWAALTHGQVDLTDIRQRVDDEHVQAREQEERVRQIELRMAFFEGRMSRNAPQVELLPPPLPAPAGSPPTAPADGSGTRSDATE